MVHIPRNGLDSKQGKSEDLNMLCLEDNYNDIDIGTGSGKECRISQYDLDDGNDTDFLNNITDNNNTEYLNKIKSTPTFAWSQPPTAVNIFDTKIDSNNDCLINSQEEFLGSAIKDADTPKRFPK